MIRVPTTILVATAPVNLHFSFDRLVGIVRESLGAEPKSDTLVIFHNRRRTHLKALWYDSNGYAVLYKRLDRGTFRLPVVTPPGATRVAIGRDEMRVLLRGLDERAILRRAHAVTRAA